MGGNATLFSEGSSNAIEPGGLNSAGKDGTAGVLTKARGSHTGGPGLGYVHVRYFFFKKKNTSCCHKRGYRDKAAILNT